MQQFLYMVFLMLFISSCDCVIQLEGKVIDSKSKEPIEGVIVEIDGYEGHDPQQVLTNNDGSFRYHRIAGRCNETTFVFLKNDYLVVRQVFVVVVIQSSLS